MIHSNIMDSIKSNLIIDTLLIYILGYEFSKDFIAQSDFDKKFVTKNLLTWTILILSMLQLEKKKLRSICICRLRINFQYNPKFTNFSTCFQRRKARRFEIVIKSNKPKFNRNRQNFFVAHGQIVTNYDDSHHCISTSLLCTCMSLKILQSIYSLSIYKRFMK